MNLEDIGKQILEALAVHGLVVALEKRAADLDRQVLDATTSIQKSKDEKMTLLQFREQGEKKLIDAIKKADDIESVLSQTKISLKAAKLAIKKDEEELTKYGDSVIVLLDEAMEQLEEEGVAIKANRDDVIKELADAKHNLEIRQVELSNNGVALSLGGKTQPKTTVL